MTKEHKYQITVEWTGNTGVGTKDYRSYERSHIIIAPQKPDLQGSSDPLFRGDTTKWNPEEMLLGSLSACHMLWYLHLCSENKIIVTDYIDQPTAILLLDPSGQGAFKEATLNPAITIMNPDQIEKAKSLHADAHKKCFIAKSINFPTKINPIITAFSNN